jgi:IS1 family transposase
MSLKWPFVLRVVLVGEWPRLFFVGRELMRPYIFKIGNVVLGIFGTGVSKFHSCYNLYLSSSRLASLIMNPDYCKKTAPLMVNPQPWGQIQESSVAFKSGELHLQLATLHSFIGASFHLGGASFHGIGQSLVSANDFVGLDRPTTDFQIGQYSSNGNKYRSDGDCPITYLGSFQGFPISSGGLPYFINKLAKSFISALPLCFGIFFLACGVMFCQFSYISRDGTFWHALIGLALIFIGCWVSHISFRLLRNNTVTHKCHLTSSNYCNTVMAIGRTFMANILSTDKQVAVISALAEGSSIRSIERITGVHRDTIMRLGVRVGQGCASLLDRKMRDLPCKQLQFDELWGFIGKKERHCTPDDSLELGDIWTFCAIDAETKIVPSFKCGKRDLATANVFVSDVASRMRNRVQISSDALRAYVDAIETSFGADVDFAQIIKTYVTDDSHIPERRFSAPEIVITEKKSIAGFPDLSLASTSHVERLNGTTRLHMRRLTRLTYAFSKKLENFNAAVALHFAYYNFVKRHITLRATPAMAAGIERDFWTVGQLIEAAV